MASQGGEVDPRCPTEENALFDEWVRSLGLGIFVFAYVYIPLTLLWWWTRRKHDMLQKRNFNLVAISSLGVLLNAFAAGWVDWKGQGHLPCEAHAFTVFLVVPLGAGPVVVRLMLFYNKHRYSNLILEENRRNKPMQLGRFQRNGIFTQLHALAALAFGLARTSPSPRRSGQVASDKGSDEGVVAAPSGAASVGEQSSDAPSERKLFALHYMSQGFSYSFGVLLFFFLLGIVTIIIQFAPADSPYLRGCYGCYLEKGDIIYMSATLLIVAILSVVFLCKLRGVDDPLGIKFELQVCLAIGLLIILGTVAAALDPGSLIKDRKFDWFFVITFGLFFFHTAQCTWPVLRTYSFGKRRSQGSELELVDVLANNKLRLVFAEYLATEFSVENLWFYDSILQYHVHYDTLAQAKLRQLANELYTSFIEEASLLEINLSSAQRRRIRDGLAASMSGSDLPPRNLFDEARDVVFQLMLQDSFPRFISSHFMDEVTIDEEESPNSVISSSFSGLSAQE